jgi:Family of unknown function (DUF695)
MQREGAGVMRFFREKSPEVGDFWAWWVTGRDRLANGIEQRALDQRLAAEISKAVATIHPQMAWELAPGKTARHAFCLSPEGRADLRQVALRWLDSAPPADATWEFHASRQPSRQPRQLEIAGARVDLAEMQAITSWDPKTRRLDVRLWHPAFASLPAQVRTQIGFLFLDNLLGEDDVERWIGKIDLLDAPTDGRNPDELRAELERRRTEPGGDATWILGTLQGPDGQVIVSADAALKRIDHPFQDIHVAIGIVLEGANGLPDEAEARALHAEEEDLLPRFEGVATFAGRTTQPGLRTLHFVAESQDRVREVIDAWALTLPPRRLKVTFQRDMDWTFRRELGLG